MRTPRQECESNIYHVIQRGTGKQIIFEDDADRRSFLDALEKEVSESEADLLCWCLMGNHFHLLLRGKMGAISSVMKRCCGRYALRFNMRHGRSGHLFQERFKSQPVEDDAQLLTVVRYIHQNPEKAGLCATADWPWSSYSAYVHPDGKSAMCQTAFVLKCFGGREAFTAAHLELSEESGCMDAFERRSKTRAMSDEDAIKTAERVLGAGSIEYLKTWDIAKRNRGVCDLYAAGLSIRQIERLSGIGRGSIGYALKKYAK